MRIAYICADRGVHPGGCGGSSTHVRELVRALVDRGHDVTLIAAAADGAADAIPCRVIDLQADAAVAALRRLIQRSARAAGDSSRAPHEVQALLLNQAVSAALAEMNPPPDVVYERQSLWSTAGLDFASRKGIPHLLEVNAPLVDQQRDYRELELVAAAEAIENLLLAGSDRVLVTSNALTDYAHLHGASRRSVRVVPCGVAASMFTDPAAEKPHDPSRFVIGFVGSLKPWHGIDVLLRAFRKLHAADRCYRLLVVGDGPMHDEVDRYLRMHGLDAFSELAGSVDPADIPGQLARMDAGVAPYPSLPTFYFSPLKLWEYAAAGVPILASETGDLPRLFPHREAALLHPPGSASKLAAHIMQLRAQPDLGARLARRARQIARTHTWDRIAARVERVAQSALRERSGKR